MKINNKIVNNIGKFIKLLKIKGYINQCLVKYWLTARFFLGEGRHAWRNKAGWLQGRLNDAMTHTDIIIMITIGDCHAHGMHAKEEAMSQSKLYLLTQSGQKLAVLEAKDEAAAASRAKGLGYALDFAPSAPFELAEQDLADPDVPRFYDEYFKMLGFR